MRDFSDFVKKFTMFVQFLLQLIQQPIVLLMIIIVVHLNGIDFRVKSALNPLQFLLGFSGKIAFDVNITHYQKAIVEREKLKVYIPVAFLA